MVRPYQGEMTPSHAQRLLLAEGQPADDRSEIADTTKVDPQGDVTPDNLQRQITHDPENTCALVLKALDRWDFYKACVQDLEDQNNQKDSQIEELLDEKQGLERNMLKMTWHLNNPESEWPKEGTPKSNASNVAKKRSAKFPDPSILLQLCTACYGLQHVMVYGVLLVMHCMLWFIACYGLWRVIVYALSLASYASALVMLPSHPLSVHTLSLYTYCLS